MTVSEFLALFDKCVKTSNDWDVHCPAHADSTPSLGIAEGDDGRILLNCRAGCKPETIVAAMNLTRRTSSTAPVSRRSESSSPRGSTSTRRATSFSRFSPSRIPMARKTTHARTPLGSGP